MSLETDDPVPDFAALQRQRFLHRAAIVVGWCLLIVFLSPILLWGLEGRGWGTEG